MSAMTRHQLRAARALLALQQEVLAAKAGVGLATLRRWENGNEVGTAIVEALERALVAEGAVLVASGAEVDGKVQGGGVVLMRDADLPEETRRRLKRFEMTSEEAASDLPDGRRGNAGRRARVPVSPKLRKPPGGEPGASASRTKDTDASRPSDDEVVEP